MARCACGRSAAVVRQMQLSHEAGRLHDLADPHHASGPDAVEGQVQVLQHLL